MGGAHPQAVLHVLKVAAPLEELQEVLALQLLDVLDRELVGEELRGLGVPEEQLVERVDDLLRVTLREGSQAGEPLEIRVGDAEEGPPARELELVELQDAHVSGVHGPGGAAYRGCRRRATPLARLSGRTLRHPRLKISFHEP